MYRSFGTKGELKRMFKYEGGEQEAGSKGR